MYEIIEDDGVDGFHNYGTCSICGGTLPYGYAEGICPECERENEEEIEERW